MIGKIATLFLIVFFIFLFTYILRRIRNPITELTIHYTDETINPDADCVISKLIATHNPFALSYIYVVKTHHNFQSTTPLLYSRIYGTKLVDCNMYLIVSIRYVVTMLTPLEDSIKFTIKDGIFTIPYLPHLMRYHVFNVIFDRTVSKSSNMYRNLALLDDDRCFGRAMYDKVRVLQEIHRGFVDTCEHVVPKTSILFSEHTDGLKISSCKTLNVVLEKYTRMHGCLFKTYTIAFNKLWN